MTRHSTSVLRIAVTGMLLVAPMTLDAQGQAQPSTPQAIAMRDANRLDSDGRTREARAIFQRLIDSAATPAARAQAQRAMAMSYAFDGDCANTVKYEEMVIAYWRTREAEEPQNAFYQQGEMANEAARACIDVGEIDVAAKYYELGSALGNREPEPRTHPRTLWDYRLHHALARLAARRGHKGDAESHVTAARRALDADTAMATAQARFFPYLTGYVAFYTNDLAKAEAELTRAVAMEGNNRDPFMHALLGMTYEKQGRAADARGMFQKAYDLATSHNPPAAFARPFARKKLGVPAGSGDPMQASSFVASDPPTLQYRSPAGISYHARLDTGTVARAVSALAAEPRSVERIIQLGVAQSGLAQFREAIQTLTRGLAIAPDNPMLYRWRGHRHLSVRELDRAMADLTRGFALDSTNYGILYHLGIVRYARGDFVGAANAFARAQRRPPDAGELAGATDWLWMSLMRAGRTVDARTMLDRRPDSLPVANAYTRRLKLYRGEISPDSMFTPADTADVQVATLSYGIGNWHLVRGDTARARHWFERSVSSGGWAGFGFILSEIELRRLGRVRAPPP